jgi:hypothetical protein
MGYRNRPEELSQIIPILAKYRKNRLHPLFRTSKDVIAFAAWVLIPGILILLICLYWGVNLTNGMNGTGT